MWSPYVLLDRNLENFLHQDWEPWNRRLLHTVSEVLPPCGVKNFSPEITSMSSLWVKYTPGLLISTSLYLLRCVGDWNLTNPCWLRESRGNLEPNFVLQPTSQEINCLFKNKKFLLFFTAIICFAYVCIWFHCLDRWQKWQ
ncbi:hypothetical protein AOLI_G00058710, partial [Acnodon oligacanthus]